MNGPEESRPSDTCPGSEALRAFAVGKLAEDVREAIAAHLAGCAACVAFLEQQEGEADSLVAELRQPLPPGAFSEPAAPQPAVTMPLAGSGAPEGTCGAGSASPGEPARPVSSAPMRYQPRRFHARGGLGEVLVAEDTELHREVALKRMQARHEGDPERRRRFLLEAEITGRLEHPGVVPVYGLGHDADGRPCYAMRFIRGETLDEAIKRFHERDGPGQPPGQRRLELRQLLGRLVAVCKTVAYVHSQGVVDRDLKPGNILLGQYGETLLVDWGLAKLVRDDETARLAGEETPVPASGDEDGTGTGLLMGTPDYMSAEQAEGKKDIGPASDIYSLGVILYKLLTGATPFTKEDPNAKLDQIKRGKVLRPRQVNKACPAALEAVCLKAMALRPEDRYGTPLRLAEDVERWLADEPVGACREPSVVRARRWARRHQVLVAAAGVGLLVTLVLSVVGAVWLRQRSAATDAAAAGLLWEARQLLEQAHRNPVSDVGKYEEARETARRAQRLADDGGASAAVRHEAAALTQELEGEAERGRREERLLAALLEVHGPRERFPKPSADDQFRAAFRDWDPGFDVDVLTTEEAAARLKGRPAAVVTEVIAALDEWAAERRRKRGDWRRVADLAAALDDPDPRRKELRALLSRNNLGREKALGLLSMALRPVPVPFDAGPGEDRGHLRRLAEEIMAADERVAGEPVLSLVTLVRALQEAGEDGSPERLLRSALRARPQEVILHDALAKLLENQRSPRWDQVAECYAAIRVRRPELGEGLANALMQGGRFGEAMDLCKWLVTLRPDNPWPRAQHGYALLFQNHIREADAAFREALRLKPDFFEAQVNRGIALAHQGLWAEAEAALRAALRLRGDSPLVHYNLGYILLALYAKLAQGQEPAGKQTVRPRLAHWQEDGDLASARDQAALDWLPDDERQQWRQLWEDVAALLTQVEGKK